MNGRSDPVPEELSKLEEVKAPLATSEKPDLDLEELKSAKGVPGFWLTVMKNDAEVKMHIEPTDEPILKQLLNVRQELLQDNVRPETRGRTTDWCSHSDPTSTSRTPSSPRRWSWTRTTPTCARRPKAAKSIGTKTRM